MKAILQRPDLTLKNLDLIAFYKYFTVGRAYSFQTKPDGTIRVKTDVKKHWMEYHQKTFNQMFVPLAKKDPK